MANMTVAVDGKNNAVILKNGSIVVVDYFHANECEFSCRTVGAFGNVFTNPIKSSSIGIKRADISETKITENIDNIVGKCIYFEDNENYIFSNLLHSE